MKTKSIISSAIVAMLLIGITAVPAAAGDRERGRFEGFALGLGAAVLGHTLMQHPSYQPGGHYNAPVDRHRPGPDFHHRSGHWELQRVWVPPAFKKVWKSGHRGPRGRWVPGCWVKVPVSGGHWDKRKVWVAGGRSPVRSR